MDVVLLSLYVKQFARAQIWEKESIFFTKLTDFRRIIPFCILYSFIRSIFTMTFNVTSYVTKILIYVIRLIDFVG